MELGDILLDQYLAPLPLARVRLTQTIQDAAAVEMAEWRLDSGDGTHVAVARFAAAKTAQDAHIVSIDSDFQRVGDLHVWGQVA